MSFYEYVIAIPSSRCPSKKSYIHTKYGVRTESKWYALSFKTPLEAHIRMKSVIQNLILLYGKSDSVVARSRLYTIETYGTRQGDRVVCNDGFSMSVQASSQHSCSPPVDFAPLYSHVEVGFLSNEEPLLQPWASELNEKVYQNVPSSAIIDVIVLHGGLKSGELPPLS